MAWIYLIIAGLLEVGWAVGLKLTLYEAWKTVGWVITTLCLSGSIWFLWLGQKSVPMGTAYAVWTGIGVIGTFGVGVIFFGDQLTFGRFISVLLILMGIIGLKLT